MSEFEVALLEALHGIRDSLDALVMLNAPEEPEAVDGCAHEWVSLGGESECRKCQSRKPS